MTPAPQPRRGHLYANSWHAGKTKLVRLPVALEAEILAAAHAIDQARAVATQPELGAAAPPAPAEEPPATIPVAELAAILDAVLNDAEVTRGAKDRGPVRRAVQAIRARMAL